MGPRSTRNSSFLTFEDATPLLVDVIDDQEPTNQPSLQAYTTSQLLYVRRISTGRRCDAAESTACSLELFIFESDASATTTMMKWKEDDFIGCGHLHVDFFLCRNQQSACVFT
jgi:hypothetical protein